MKIRDTVERLVADYPSLRTRYTNVVLACAYELSDSFAMRVIRANEAMNAVDPDDEPAWYRACDERDEAERVFLDVHANTEMTL
jgi:hypothetical protein